MNNHFHLPFMFKYALICCIVQIGATALSQDKSIDKSKPFAILRNCTPKCATQAQICATVKITKPPIVSSVKTKNNSTESTPKELLVYEVEVIDGAGLDAKAKFRCFSLYSSAVMSVPSSGQYLLVGWKTLPSGRLPIELNDPPDAFIGRLPMNVAGDSETIFAILLIPVRFTNVIRNTNLGKRFYLNLAEVIAGKPDETILRQVTSSWALVNDPDRLEGENEGQVAAYWVPRLLLPRLKGITQSTPLEKVRIGGVIASWEKERYAVEYWRSLPKLFTDLRSSKETYSLKGYKDDIGFISMLGIISNVDPNEILSAINRVPGLEYIALSPRLGKPSLENQKSLLNYLNSTDPNIRGRTLDQFARWYGENDKRTAAKWSEADHCEIVPGEQELSSYWRKKVGGADGP